MPSLIKRQLKTDKIANLRICVANLKNLFFDSLLLSYAIDTWETCVKLLLR